MTTRSGKVALAPGRRQVEGDTTIQQIQVMGGECCSVLADVSKQADVQISI